MVEEGRYASREGRTFYYDGTNWFREFQLINREGQKTVRVFIPGAGYVPLDPKDQTKGKLYNLNSKERVNLVAELELIVNPSRA